jgi:hypothetical protein
MEIYDESKISLYLNFKDSIIPTKSILLEANTEIF